MGYADIPGLCDCCAAPGGCGLFCKSVICPCWTCFDIVRQYNVGLGNGPGNANLCGFFCGGAYGLWYLPACMYGTSSWSGIGTFISAVALGYYSNETMINAKNAGILTPETGCGGCCDNKCDPASEFGGCNYICSCICPACVLVQTRNTQLRLAMNDPGTSGGTAQAYMAPKQMCLRM